jgi:hypothetical protein
MPADDRLGLHDHEVLRPVPEQPPHQHPERAVAVLELRSRRIAPQHVELLTEGDVLEREACAVRGEGADEGQQIEEQVHAEGSATAAVDGRVEAR